MLTNYISADALNTPALASYAGLVLAFIGLPVTYFLARGARRAPDIRTAFDFDVLLRPHDGLTARGLALTYGGATIASIARTYFAIWNGAGDTFESDQVLSGDPLRIAVAPGDRILTVRVVCASREQIDPRVSLVGDERDEALIAFDFLDAGDGAVFELIHQGPQPPSLCGTVKGARLGTPKAVDLTPSKVDSNGKRKLPIAEIVVLLVASLGLLTPLALRLWSVAVRGEPLRGSGSAALLYGVTAFVLLLVLAAAAATYTTHRRVVPKSLGRYWWEPALDLPASQAPD